MAGAAAERARDGRHEGLIKVGPDESFEAKKIVSGRNLPMRCARIDAPARKIPGIEVGGLNRQRHRPNALEAVAFPLKQLAISLRTARLITGDVDDMPSPHRADTGLAYPHPSSPASGGG